MSSLFQGFNTFALSGVSGALVQGQWRPESVLQVKEECLVFRPSGPTVGAAIEFSYSDIASWDAIDRETAALHLQSSADPVRRPSRAVGGGADSGIEIRSAAADGEEGGGMTVFFALHNIRDAKHTLEFFWNTFQVANGGTVKLGSTHGRPLVTVATLSGDKPPPEALRGQSEVVDLDGTLVRTGARMAPRRSSALLATASAVMGGSAGGHGKEAKLVPPEIREIKTHWHKVVLHQGWLLKKGGVGLDVIATKSWIKRYFVLYATSQVRVYL